MASNSHNNNKENSSSWTRMQNKQFESALALYDQDTPDRWQNIAKVVGDKSAEEVKRHYEILLEDLSHIESGRVPIPSYKSTDNNEERLDLISTYCFSYYFVSPLMHMQWFNHGFLPPFHSSIYLFRLSLYKYIYKLKLNYITFILKYKTHLTKLIHTYQEN